MNNQSMYLRLIHEPILTFHISAKTIAMILFYFTIFRWHNVYLFFVSIFFANNSQRMRWNDVAAGLYRQTKLYAAVHVVHTCWIGIDINHYRIGSSTICRELATFTRPVIRGCTAAYARRRFGCVWFAARLNGERFLKYTMYNVFTCLKPNYNARMELWRKIEEIHFPVCGNLKKEK